MLERLLGLQHQRHNVRLPRLSYGRRRCHRRWIPRNTTCRTAEIELEGCLRLSKASQLGPYRTEVLTCPILPPSRRRTGGRARAFPALSANNAASLVSAANCLRWRNFSSFVLSSAALSPGGCPPQEPMHFFRPSVASLSNHETTPPGDGPK